MEGLGPVELVSARINTPLLPHVGPVEVTSRGSIVTHMDGRAYFADRCVDGAWNPNEYKAMQLLNRTLRYSVNLAGAACGCNVAFYLTSLHQNAQPSKCGDYYCDACSVCGVACAEIDIQEANLYAFHSTTHLWDDPGGRVGLRAGGKDNYGPGGLCIDTRKAFEVAVSFPLDQWGHLMAINVTLSQRGSSCPISGSVGHYLSKRRPALKELEEALRGGMTPILSYWNSPTMLWLDGESCPEDTPSLCADTAEFWDFSIENMPARPVRTQARGTSVSSYFWPMDGGSDRACRGTTIFDTRDDYYQVEFGVPLSECQGKCASWAACTGVEHQASTGRCELWTHAIATTAPVQGFTCSTYMEEAFLREYDHAKASPRVVGLMAVAPLIGAIAGGSIVTLAVGCVLYKHRLYLSGQTWHRLPMQQGLTTPGEMTA